MNPVQRAGVKMLDVKNLIRDLNGLYDYGEVKFDSYLTYLMNLNLIKRIEDRYLITNKWIDFSGKVTREDLISSLACCYPPLLDYLLWKVYQEAYAIGLSGDGEALIETPELTIAASLDIYEYLGEWIASEAQSDKQKLNELFEQIEAVPDTWPVVSSYVFEDRRLTENKPVGVISSGFGWRKRIFQIKNLISRNGVLYEFHTGIDIRSSLRTPVVASAPGEVIATEWVKGYGNLVIIDHGYNYETYYAHLSEFKIQPGDKVERGQLIGLIGESGRATGPHLHFEIRLKDVPMNPYGFIKLKE